MCFAFITGGGPDIETTERLIVDMAAISDGVIIGSAIVKLVAKHGGESIEPVREFVKTINLTA